jgi:hypothetical protein
VQSARIAAWALPKALEDGHEARSFHCPAFRSSRTSHVLRQCRHLACIGIVSLARVSGGAAGQPIMLLVIAVLMLGNAGAMVVAGAGLSTRWRRPAYYWGLAVLAINIILTFRDQFGVFDLLTLLFDLALLGLLIAARKCYSAADQGAKR